MKITPKYFYGIIKIINRDFIGIPPKIRMLVFALFVYTIAWGILEPLQAIYFSSFVSSYFEIGVIFALFNIVLLFLAIPAGALSDRVKATKLVQLGFLLYPAIGAFYFTATNIIQLNVTRILNGIGATLVWVSGESFIRKNSPEKKTAETFGFYNTAVNFAYVTGAIVGAFLIMVFTIRQLFLFLFPIPLIAALLVWRIRLHEKKEQTIIKGMEEVLIEDGLGTRELMDFFSLGLSAFYCLLLVFFGGFFYQLLMVFIPLTAKKISMDLSGILLLYALMHVPFLLCFFFSEITDRIGKPKVIISGLVLTAISLFFVFFFASNIAAFILFCFLFGTSLAIVGPAINGLITDLAPKNESGEITGITNAAYCLGAAAGPLFFGAFADKIGLFESFVAAAIIAIALAILTFALKGFLTRKGQNVASK